MTVYLRQNFSASQHQICRHRPEPEILTHLLVICSPALTKNSAGFPSGKSTFRPALSMDEAYFCADLYAYLYACIIYIMIHRKMCIIVSNINMHMLRNVISFGAIHV